MGTAAVIACELGPNPAPIVELVWALFREEGVRIRTLFLLTNDRGEKYLWELEHALGLLEEVFGWAPECAPLAFAWSPDGTRVDQDLSDAEAQAWMRARWTNYKRAFEAAGDEPVVFAIAANRERSVHATGMFTLLARPQDLCFDVRVSEPRVEGAKAGFYFPEQRTPCADEHGPIDPSGVKVHLIELQLPRLRPLLGPADLGSFDSALAASQAVVEEVRPPQVVWVVGERRITVDGQPLKLSGSQLLWYASMLLARKEGEGWVEGKELAWIQKVVDLEKGATSIPLKPLGSAVFKQDYGADLIGEYPQLRQLRAKAVRALTKWCGNDARLKRLLVPEKRKQDGATSQRVPLAPRHIRLDGNVANTGGVPGGG